MPIISFLRKNRLPIEVPTGANLMRALLAASVPVASSCNGDGVCAKCRIRVFSSSPSHVNSPNEIEIFLQQKFELKTNERISCQTQVLGDLQVDTSYW